MAGVATVEDSMPSFLSRGGGGTSIVIDRSPMSLAVDEVVVVAVVVNDERSWVNVDGNHDICDGNDGRLLETWMLLMMVLLFRRVLPP